jgi:hypothetical protein
LLKATLADYMMKDDASLMSEPPRLLNTGNLGNFGSAEQNLRTKLEQTIMSVLQNHNNPVGHGLRGVGPRDDAPVLNGTSLFSGGGFLAEPNYQGLGCDVKTSDEIPFQGYPFQDEPEPLPAFLRSYSEESVPLAVPPIGLQLDDPALELNLKVDLDKLQSLFGNESFLYNEQHQVQQGDEVNDRTSAEIQARRDLAAAGGGLSNCTTVMLRHIPVKVTQRKLIRELNGAGFSGHYDFLYMPMDLRRNVNRGSAFINFISPEVAERFYLAYHDKHLRTLGGDTPENDRKVLNVLPADVQGFEQNALHQYAALCQTHPAPAAAASKPIFLRPLPPRLAHVMLAAGQAPAPPTGGPQKTPPLPPVSRAPVSPSPGPLQHQVMPPHPQANRSQESPHASEALVPKFCVFCGKGRLGGHSFCPYCGGKFF